MWEDEPPELCTTVAATTLEGVAARANVILTELFDGESYLVVHFV
jgi:hypothetical protein